METVQVEVWVLVDEDGNAVASCDADTAADLYDQEVGGNAAAGRRVIQILLTVPKPKTTRLCGVVPPEPQGGTLAAR